MTDDSFRQERERMVDRTIAARDIRDPRVLQAMRTVPRHLFVPPEQRGSAYRDMPLPIGFGQTISQPYIVALMAAAAEIGPGDRVLEVGAGSGYAAAVLAALGDHFYTVERHGGLADAAASALREAGVRNVTVRTGDGTLGWPDAAPFDAILVAAGAPAAPETLKRQLAIGGRLVIPVSAGSYQNLTVIRRTGPNSYAEATHGAVRFVPLIGAEGYEEEGCAPARLGERDLPAAIDRAAIPLPDIGDPAFAKAFDRLRGTGIVGLGEATHGTSEFYTARAAITRRLIERHGVRIVALEADWPDAVRLDRHVRHRAPLEHDEPPFTRFPTWMWRNGEFRAFVDWLREFNAGRPAEDRVSLHGLDLYALDSSIAAVIDYLDETDDELARLARQRYACLTPWQEDPTAYARAAYSRSFDACEDAVAAMLRDVMARRAALMHEDGDDFLDAEGNARLVASAERYYREMFRGRESGWNLRDIHMVDTLDRVRAARGGARAVVWAHNSHIGDARATEMGRRGQVTVGSLCRERHGADVLLVGFGTDGGTVAAADDWGGEMRIKDVRPALSGSVEALCRESGGGRFLLDFTRDQRSPLGDALREDRLERAIGVIYRPETERQSHYFHAALTDQFDHWVWFDETRAVNMPPHHEPHGPADTYPFGL
ncbi:protein-L-isoaspartate(D-aspartate) O-methyltransferase [Roseitranquillus sediminis]|uniref:protein-L-isoaspartate(D-aspartate) O-methyltransferase n=1 Tax=Roseitranquillus sediminis TaxID=2809051 RepID=UPI001D0C89C5|nr:protein-L-isoaspartate(D-aspartate) O-methyltransferase [Roseitranquillus sediminis]MBM9595732.1 protein-L-isoaspartate(D-aspartate) O-methyltransferase [Roseitranquillus sediminis]